MLEVNAIRGLGEIGPATDLARELARALRISELTVAVGDVLVVTQKIVSKAEDRWVDLCAVSPSKEAHRLAATTGKDPRLVEVVLKESSAVLRAVPGVLITRHRRGWVMANAGIDRSNLGPGAEDRILLLPRDPDTSAARLKRDLALLLKVELAVVISDSFGRPWRNGVVNVALGVAGAPALIDRRGDLDRDGRRLEVTQIAFGDMIATAAGLVMGEGAEGVPAALVHGLSWGEAPLRPATALNRPLEQDLFQ